MKRLKKEEWEEPYLTISDFPLQRWCMLFAVILQTSCSVTANRFAELCSEKLLMNRTVMGHCYQDFLR